MESQIHFIKVFGTVVTISGNRINRTSSAAIAEMKGSEAFAPLKIGTFPIFDAMNKHAPTGGVTNPIANEITVMIPKNIGSIPTDWINGKKIGHNSMILAPRSINIPVMK